MNALIYLNGADVTDSCRLQDTRINYDSSRRITTAALTVMGRTLSKASRYDLAHYDLDRYSIDIGELFLCTILDGRDGTTKLFEGRIFSLQMEQSDTPAFEVFYKCELNDYAAWLDRAVCWGGYVLTLPSSDAVIIRSLLGQFCSQIDAQADVAEVVPVIEFYDWRNKTARQVLDDMAALAGAEWHVDFDGVLHYRLAADAPVAPFALSTSPDGVTSFPVRVSGYKRDFNNPVNRCYVRGATDPDTGSFIEANYADPISVGRYGELAATVVDEQIVTGWDAALRAKSVVLRYAYPVESGSFTVWAKDGLRLGQQVSITEDGLGISGWYVIRSLSMQWITQDEVQYDGQFGASQPDLETLLRLLDQRTRWKTSVRIAGAVTPGSVTDASIAPPGLHASSIASVNAGTIQGSITAGQIGSVNAGTILGQISADQIGSVNAGSIVGVLSAGQIGSVNAATIQGSITAGQIGSVNATTIQGVIVSDQLANHIIDDLGKYAAALAPVPMMNVFPTGLPNDNNPPGTYFYYIPDGHFYRMNGTGTGWTLDDAVSGSQRFYHIGAITAASIIGLIVAAQIQTITAGQITGTISGSQIGTINASTIVGQLTAAQIASVSATAIQGGITSTQITSLDAAKITGSIQANQIGTVAATQITGTIAAAQIGSINAATINIGQLVDSQIAGMSGAKLSIGSVASDKFNGYSIDVGGLANMPGRIRVFSNTGVVTAQMGYLGEVGTGAYGGWFALFGAGGTGYASAKVYTDSAGNLFLKDANFNISGQIYTSPSTFDTSYSTLALKNDKSPDLASFISRGLVIYYQGSKVGALVRAPGGAWLELECTTGGAYTLISGSVGVRSDAGYLVGGNRVINASGQFAGLGVNCPNYTITGSGFAVNGYGVGALETVGPFAMVGGGQAYLVFRGGIYYGHYN